MSTVRMLSVLVLVLVSLLMALTQAADAGSGQHNAETSLFNTSYSPWYRYRDRCLRYVSTPLNWVAAEKNCESMGATLASVSNIQQNRDIQSLIFALTQAYGETWIGGSDAQEEKSWLWSNGTPFTYTHWCAGEPSAGGSQRCLQINYTARKCWDNLWCTSQHPSVCLKKC